MPFPITNYCLYLYIDGKSKKYLIPKLLLQVSVREIHNSMGVPPEEGGLKEVKDEYNNIIIIDSTLRNVLPPQLKNITYQ